jgi:hypothetical protein
MNNKAKNPIQKPAGCAGLANNPISKETVKTTGKTQRGKA